MEKTLHGILLDPDSMKVALYRNPERTDEIDKRYFHKDFYVAMGIVEGLDEFTLSTHKEVMEDSITLNTVIRPGFKTEMERYYTTEVDFCYVSSQLNKNNYSINHYKTNNFDDIYYTSSIPIHIFENSPIGLHDYFEKTTISRTNNDHGQMTIVFKKLNSKK